MPDPTLRLRVAKQGPLPFALRVTVATQLVGMASTLMGEADVDEIRYQISDKRIFRFVARQLVSVLHVAFDYLAFSEDVGFYVGRETFHGVSAATLLWGLARDLVIYLYLLDADAGKLVLWGLVMSLATDVFKIQKVLRPRLVLTRRGPRAARRSNLRVGPASNASPKLSRPLERHQNFDGTFGNALLEAPRSSTSAQAARALRGAPDGAGEGDGEARRRAEIQLVPAARRPL